MRREKRPRRWLRILGRIGLGLIVLVIVTGITGFSWNELVTRHYLNAYPVPGKFYSVDGGKMHIYCTGTGAPTLILDAGAGDDWTVWTKVQSELSKTTQVCSFDRSGLGSSDVLLGGHDANSLADQLHALVGQAGIKTPFVLAGHSIAGIYMRAYTAKFPSDVAGLIFIDSSHPDQLQRFPKAFTQASPNLFVMSWMTRLGIARAMGQCTDLPPGVDAVKGFAYANICRPSVVDSGLEEIRAFPRSTDETRHTGPFGRLPILIISEDPEVQRKDTSLPPDVMAQTSIAWNQMQEDLKQLSLNSRRVIAARSSHYVQLDRPDVIDREVPEFIEHIRHGTPMTEVGTTRVE
ncbi:alpha/beta hydrolase [Dyella sp. 2HG41-7]|uniref:alpha/beta fold hydrolase n=1 Tax=Dyella sp. 2HG41-7 TaxID=2883239 RepID=UPI001F234D7B|nr:alpha/beta hydrolase [Dyella sp. 2HG41-7]